MSDYRVEKIDRLCGALELAIISIEEGKGLEIVPRLLTVLKASPRETQEWPMDHTKWPFFIKRKKKEEKDRLVD